MELYKLSGVVQEPEARNSGTDTIPRLDVCVVGRGVGINTSLREPVTCF